MPRRKKEIVDPNEVYLMTTDVVEFLEVCRKFRDKIEPEVIKAAKKALAINNKRTANGGTEGVRRFGVLMEMLKYELEFALVCAAIDVQGSKPVRKSKRKK